jgi:hypothetical protein
MALSPARIRSRKTIFSRDNMKSVTDGFNRGHSSNLFGRYTGFFDIRQAGYNFVYAGTAPLMRSF